MLCIGAFFQSFADNVGIDAAKDKAAQFLMERSGNVLHSQSRTPVQTVPELEIAHVEMAQGDALYYVFDKGQDDGFIVVSAEDRTPAVLCYVDEGKFELDNMAPAAQEMMTQYADYICRVRNGISSVFAESPQRKPIYPLLKTHWEQEWPFNVKCPDNSLTGCVATSFAQVMVYYKWPDRGEGTHTYTYETEYGEQTLSVEYGNDVYQYDLMIDDWPASPISYDAISTLVYHVGVASDMKYGQEESSATLEIALDGMKHHFKYNSDARMEYAEYYDSITWENMLYNELAQGRPVVYRGVDESAGGHAFVLDGYEDGYFHVNWGWHGNYDGFFLLTTMMGYKSLQAACFDFKPIDHESEPEKTDSLLRWGYCNDMFGLAMGGDTVNGGAIYIPPMYLEAYKGKKISGMEIGLSEACRDFECFVYETTNPNPEAYSLDDEIIDSVLFRKYIGTGKFGWNKIMFDEPIEIDGNGLFFGYTVNEADMYGAVGLATNEELFNDHMNYANIHYDGGVWCWGTDYILCINALLADEDLPADMRMFMTMDNIESRQTGNGFNIVGMVESMMVEQIENYTVAYQIGDGETHYYTVDSKLKSKQRELFSVPVHMDLPAGMYDLRVWIEKVNGKEDAVQCNSDYYRRNPIQLKIHGQTFPRRNVMMSNISTDVGYSDRVIVYDSILHNKYPEKYIGINIHQDFWGYGSDPMSNNENFEESLSVPRTKINGKECDNTDLSFLEENLSNSQNADFSLTIQTAFSNNVGNTVSIVTEVVSGMDIADKDLRIAYAVTENHVGPYAQSSIRTDLPVQWQDGDCIYHDRVARGIYYNENGIPASLPSNMKTGTVYKHQYCLELPKNIDDISQIQIIAMIVNQSTGEIENACQCIPSAYEGIDLDLSESEIYLMEGNTRQLDVIVSGLPDDAEIIWSSSNSDVVTVSDNGIVTAGNEIGKAQIMAQLKERPYIFASCQVFVSDKDEIVVETPGTLANLLGDNMGKYSMLKICGELDGNDLLTLRRMAGIGIDENDKYPGHLEILDLSNADFVEGGGAYYNWFVLNGDRGIPDYGFYGCNVLKKIICPISCEFIGIYAFDGCTSLESIVLNEGLQRISFGAFNNTRIKELDLPASFRELMADGWSPNSISTVKVEEGNQTLISVDGVLFSKDMSTLCHYPSGKFAEELLLLAPIKHIGTLYEGGGIMPNQYLKRLYLDSVEDAWVWAGKSLELVYFGNDIKTIGDNIFWDNYSTETILCKSIEPPLFKDDYQLVPSETIQENAKLYVPRESIEAYKAAPIWGLFNNILPIEEYEGDSTYNKIQELHNTYFTVSYYVGDSIVHTDQVLYGKTVPEYAYEPQKEGYTFSGWSEIPATMPANDVVVNGTFRVNNYLLTYVVDDVIYQSDTLEYGSEIIPAEAPNAAGKTFMGWENLPASMPAENIQVIGHLYSLLTGDANNDTEVNVGDFSSTVNYILERPAPGFVKLMADVDSNEDINVADVVGITNIILDYDYPSMAIGRSPNRESDVIDNFNLTQIAETEHDIIISLNMSSQNMFTAFQLDIDLPKGMVIKAARLSDNKDNSHMVSFGKLSNGEWRVISASLNGKQLKTDEVSLLILELERTEEDDSMLISVHDALFSDRNLNITEAVDCSLLLSGNPTCINKITVDDSEPVYNINGTKLTGDVSNGLFIINGKKVLKHE